MVSMAQVCVVLVANDADQSMNSFLLARLHMDSLENRPRPSDLRRALKTLPPALVESYEEKWKEVREAKDDWKHLAKQTLLWLHKARQPLTLEELQIALAIDEDNCDIEDEDLYSADEILSSCMNLVVIDEETNVLSLLRPFAQPSAILMELIVEQIRRRLSG